MPARFSIREAINTGETTGNVVTATSDIPAHLWMRWTSVAPRIHKIPVLRRGMWLNDDVRFCFDVYQDIEQDEDGDTLIHTFTISPCVSGRHFYYYIWGYIGGVLSPSSTSLMEYHHGIQCPDILFLTVRANTSNRTARQTWGTWDIAHDRPLGTIGPQHGIPLVRLYATATLTASYWIWRSFLRFDTSPIPAGSNIMAASIAVYVIAVNKSAQIPYRNIIATRGVQDNPVIPANYGDQLPITTNGGQVHLDACIPNFPALIHLNAQGLAWIVPEAESTFCIRQELDVLDIPPTLGSNALVYNSAQAAYLLRPRLIIQYREP